VAFLGFSLFSIVDTAASNYLGALYEIKQQIYEGKKQEVERKENILKTAINYLKLLIKLEIGEK